MAKMNEYTLHKMFDKLAGFDKNKIIKEVMKANALSRETAMNYFYQWKKIYTNGSDCVPKEVKMELLKQEAAELQVAEVIADPEIIIETAKAIHEVNIEPIKEFTAEEKEEIKAFVEAEMTEKPFEMSMKLKGKIFTYELDDSGVIIAEGWIDTITAESINEQQRALDAWNKYFGRDGLSIR